MPRREVVANEKQINNADKISQRPRTAVGHPRNKLQLIGSMESLTSEQENEEVPQRSSRNCLRTELASTAKPHKAPAPESGYE